MQNTELKLDNNGLIDIDHYVKLSREMRSAYVAEMTAALVAKIKRFFTGKLPELDTTEGPSLSH